MELSTLTLGDGSYRGAAGGQWASEDSQLKKSQSGKTSSHHPLESRRKGLGLKIRAKPSTLTYYTSVVLTFYSLMDPDIV
ncbi:hypothetical protein NQZ68_007759 [Dissostichus eleginoides]|nr:hypothetical protein NQZ68_007759 [Dissostichus eleginoides]